MIKDATCDAAIGNQIQLNATFEGAAIVIAGIAGLTTTAQNSTITQSFNNPIKLDRNTTISISGNSYTAGLRSNSCCIMGYTVEN